MKLYYVWGLVSKAIQSRNTEAFELKTRARRRGSNYVRNKCNKDAVMSHPILRTRSRLPCPGWVLPYRVRHGNLYQSHFLSSFFIFPLLPHGESYVSELELFLPGGPSFSSSRIYISYVHCVLVVDLVRLGEPQEPPTNTDTIPLKYDSRWQSPVTEPLEVDTAYHPGLSSILSRIFFLIIDPKPLLG